MNKFARALLAVAACATVAVSTANADVKVRYFKGQPTFISTMHTSVVEVAAPASPRDRRVGVGIAVFNRGAQPMSLGYENVSVRTVSGAPVKLVNYDELQHEARVRAGWATFFAIVAAGASGYAAVQSGYGHVGGYSYYDPTAAQIGIDRASAESAAMFGSISQSLDATMSKLDGTVLRTTTVDPGTSFGGAVFFDLPHDVNVADVIVTVTFAGESHDVPLNATASALQQATAADLTNPAFHGGSAAASDANSAPLGVATLFGADVTDMPAAMATDLRMPALKGAYVERIEPGSLAERSGLKSGDTVVSFNGDAIRGSQALIDRLQVGAPGKLIPIGVVRGVKMTQVDVQF